MKMEHRISTIELSFLIIFSILLILVGSGLLINEFNHYSDVVAQNQDTYLLNSVRYIDNNLSIQLSTYHTALEHVLSHRGFASAFDSWRTGDSADKLLQNMRDTILIDNSSVAALLAACNGEVLLSTNGVTDYVIPQDANGELHIGIAQSYDGVSFIILLDLSSFYLQMEHSLPVDTDRLFLLHSETGIFIFATGEQPQMASADSFPARHRDAAILSAMQESQSSAAPLTTSYSHHNWDDMTESRLAVIPAAQLLNGQFTIGLTVNYGAITAPLYQSMQKVLFLATGTMIGVTLLMFATIYAAMSNVRRNRELEELHLKNREMTELTEKTLSLYHHQRLETIGTLTSSIAHEFGNLLTPIMGYSIMALEALPPESDEMADYLQEIYSASCSAKTIISRLNDLSRKNTGASYVYIAPDDLVRRTTSVTQPVQPENVTAQLHLNAENVLLHGNETQLTQLLLNLILNAYHAMKESGGVLTISTSVERNLLRIRVQDTGKGIRPEHIEKIFDPFFTTREAGKGTGLGLSISLQVAREHGGDITVCSCLGEGSTFDVVLPLQQPPEDTEYSSRS